MFSTSWSICGIDTDGHDLTLSRLVAWGEAGELVPTTVVSAIPPITGTVDNLLVDDATTVTFAAADVRQPGFLITFEFAEPVELWGWRMAALTRTGWPRMHAVSAGEHVQFLGRLEWQGSGALSALPRYPVNLAQEYGVWAALSSGSREWYGVATHDGVTVYAAGYNDVLYKSIDGGATWAALSSGSRTWCGVATHDGVTVYAVVWGGLIYKSTDGGATWAALSSDSREWYDVATHDGVTVYASLSGNAIYKSTDGGTTWAALSAAGSRVWRGVATHDGVTVYAAVRGGVIYKSTDGGATWVALSSGSREWYGVATHDGVTVYAAVYKGAIYKSTDGGATWAALSAAVSRVWRGVATYGGVTFYATVENGAIYKGTLLPSIYSLELRALATSTSSTNGAPPVETATLTVEPVFTTQDLDVGGRGRIYGTVKRKADPQNIPLVRRVRLHDSRTGSLLRQTWSQTDGSYEFRDLSPDLEFDVVAWDHERHFRSEIANNLKPEVQA